MPKQLYVFPNISALNRNGTRGNYWERLKLAKRHGCFFVELPAHLLRSKTEIRRTGQEEGDIASETSIVKMYGASFVPSNLRYILHTEPALISGNLRWYDRKWTEDYISMIIGISKQIGIGPSYVEVHPGNKKNSYDDILSFVEALYTRYEKEGMSVPSILLENRTEHRISCGEDMQELYSKMESDYPHLSDHFGFVVDIRTMYTQMTKNHDGNYGDKLIESIMSTPAESIYGVHIHNTHLRAPSLYDEVPWERIMQMLRNLNKDIIINPEVHSESLAEATLRFVRSFF